MRNLASLLCVLALAMVTPVGCGPGNGGGGGSGGAAGASGSAGSAGTGGMAGTGGVGGAPMCASPSDCDDENPCTENLCNLAEGTCSNPTFMDGTICSGDENMGRCVAGVCTGLCEFVDCDDGNECTEDRCDTSDGTCINSPVSDGTVCDAGGDPGQCSAGLCVGLCAEADCDDGRECTEDLCDPTDGSCDSPNRPDGSTCDFGGLPGRCASGTCVDAELCGLVDCGDDNDCTEDVCNPANAVCSNPDKVDGAFCETDGNPGLCSAGLCQGLCELVSCDDGNQCTVDMCDPSNGSCPNPDSADGSPCSYGDLPGKCSAGLCVGLCTGVVCNDHNQCTSDACDTATGSCTHDPVANGTTCEFGGLAGICISGTCDPSVFPCTEQGIRDAIARGGGPYTFACNGPTTVVTEAEIIIDNDVILDGEGNLTVSGASPRSDHRVFSLPAGFTAELSSMTITEACKDYNLCEDRSGLGIRNDGTLTITKSNIESNGLGTIYVAGPGEGGGIYNSGTLTLADSVVANNGVYDSGGGGIYNSGTLTLMNTVVSDNYSSFGGGIHNDGTLLLVDSTVERNQSDGDGGGLSINGTALLLNSIVSSNYAELDGGGIAVLGQATLINSTVSGNRATSAHQAYVDGVLTLISSTLGGLGSLYIAASGEMRATNSLLKGSDDNYPRCEGTGMVTSLGGNIESPNDSCGFDAPTDQVNVSAEDLKLGPLADNGGPTMTHALLPGSVAIDRIPPSMCVDADGQPLTEDQRGEPRPGGTMCDVGAFEVQP